MERERSGHGRDRRQHERLKYEGTLQVRAAGESRWMAVDSRDISVGGLSFLSEIEMHVGDSCTVWMPEVDVSTFPATVRHVHVRGDRWLVGVEFDESLMAALGHLMRAP